MDVTQVKEIVGLVLMIVLVLFILGLIIYALWRNHEDELKMDEIHHKLRMLSQRQFRR